MSRGIEMKTEERFNKLLDDIQEIKEHQAHIRADLNYHIKRTDLLEGFMKSQIKVLLTIVTAVLAALAVAFFSEARAQESIGTIYAAIQAEVPCKIRIHSSKRTPEHNKRVGGAPNSYHLKGRALDISAKCLSHKELGKIAIKHANGVLVYKSHVHIDNRPNKLYKEM